MKNETLETIFTIILYALMIGLLITIIRFLQNDWPNNVGAFVIAQSSLIALVAIFKFSYAKKSNSEEEDEFFTKKEYCESTTINTLSV